MLDLPTPRRLFGCSPARLTSWLDCPRRYRLVYFDRPRPRAGPPTAPQSAGASVHAALRAWWDLPAARRTPAAAGALLDARWVPAEDADPTRPEADRVRCREMVVRYVATLDPLEEPVGLERLVAAKTATLAIHGRVDRIDERAGELVVVDYKTGRQLLCADDARGSLALAIYALLTERVLRRPCRRVELHHLPSGRVLGWEHTTASLARHLGRAEDVAVEARAAEESVAGGADPDLAFPPRPGPRCGWCEVAAHCPAAASAASVRPARVPERPARLRDPATP